MLLTLRWRHADRPGCRALVGSPRSLLPSQASLAPETERPVTLQPQNYHPLLPRLRTLTRKESGAWRGTRPPQQVANQAAPAPSSGPDEGFRWDSGGRRQLPVPPRRCLAQELGRRQLLIRDSALPWRLRQTFRFALAPS